MNNELYDLTNPQKSIWDTEQYYNGSTVNNICGTLYFKQKIDFSKLSQAVSLVVSQNDIFKLKFVITDKKTQQYFGESSKYVAEVVPVANKKELNNLCLSLSHQHLNISENSLFNFKIFKESNNFGGVIIVISHLLSDSWTLGLISKEIVNNYNNLINNVLPNEQSYSYLDFIKKEEKYLSSPSFIKDKEYWNNLFSTIPEVATIPTSKKNLPNSTDCSAGRESFVVDSSTVANIVEFCKQNNLSSYSFFMSVFALYINRVTNLEDFSIGTPILNRTGIPDKQTLGMFVSTVPLRIQVDSSESFVSFSHKVSQSCISMLRHQRYPYQKLLADLREKNSSIPSLYSTLLSYQITKAVNNSDNTNYETGWVFNGNSADDFQMHIVDYNDTGSLTIFYDYKINKYSKNDILNIHNRLAFIIQQILQNNSILTNNIEIVTKSEKEKLLYEFNNDSVTYPKDLTVIDLFEEQVKITPNNVAVIFDNKNMSYTDLNKKANQLARYLVSLGIKEHDIIAIRLDKSFEMIIGILAIMKAGCTYLPINMSYPEERVSYMLEDSKAKFLLTSNASSTDLALDIKVIAIDLSIATIYKENLDSSNLNIKQTPEDLIYIIYTSGSTGKPKGATLCHRNVVRLLKNSNPLYDFNENDVWTMFHSVAFDFSVWEMYGALLFGGKLVLVTDEIAKDTNLFLDLLRKENVTILNQTPTYFYNLLSSELERADNDLKVRYVIFGGEALKPKLIHRWKEKYPLCKLINMYGITETTVHVTFKELSDKDLKSNKSNIGKPIPTLQVLVLDKHLNLLPCGVAGEMCVLGDGVFKGYLNRPDLNEQKLVKSKYYNGKVLYRSADSAIMHEDGDLEYLGRIDKQVKIRGFRVELGEIEEQILKTSSIKSCIVTKKVDSNEREMLCAYYIKNSIVDIDKLKRNLQKDLPYYMIPQYFIEISCIPTNINGKTDVKSLPMPTLIEHTSLLKKERNPIDKILVQSFSKFLHIKEISIDDSFFDLGGDSLSAISISSYLSKELTRNIAVKDILENPTIYQLSDLIATKENFEITSKITKSKIMPLYPVSLAQSRIYYSTKLAGEDSLIYNTPGAILIDSLLDKSIIENSINKIIENQSSFRSSFVVESDGKLYQKILKQVDFSIEISNNTESNIESILGNFSKPFDLEKAPLLRVHLCYLDNKKTLLLFDSHHIIMDGSSLSIFVRSLSTLLNGYTLDCLPIEYTDYSVWEREWINSSEFKSYEKYWLNLFKETDFSDLRLPYDYIPTTSLEDFHGNTISKTINNNLYKSIIDLANKQNVSPYAVYLTAFFILLYKYTNQTEIIIGSPIANRPFEEETNIIGMFVNNLSIISNIRPNEMFTNFLIDMQKQISNDIENSLFPYDILLKKLNLDKNKSLFDVMFTYQNENIKTDNSNYFDMNKVLRINNHISKFNLSFEIVPNTQTLNIEYKTSLFKEETIENFYKHYINILGEIINNSNVSIKNINMLSDLEEKNVLYNFNNKTLDFPIHKSIIDLFNQTVRNNRNNIAIITKDSNLTYKNLDEKSNALAQLLQDSGVKKGDVVGVCLSRSAELLTSIFAILKCGCIYMPMYVNYPKNRLIYMLENSKATVLITNTNISYKLPFVGTKLILDTINSLDDIPSIDNNITVDSSSAAYMIYTSGSTGKPKGVLISNVNLMNFIYNFNNYYGAINNSDTFLASTNISFDVSIWEFFLSLLNGAKLVLYHDEIVRDIVDYCDAICNYSITSLYIAPNILNEVYSILKERENVNINKLLVGVEPIKKSTLNKFFNLNSKMTIINGYGPTETTICCTALKYVYDVSNDNIVSIGTPLKNNNIYIVNVDNQLQPINIPGELCVSGLGVGLGYINNLHENKKRFINNIFDNSSSYLYKTGDIAKWNKDGSLTFIGRNDSQVKISGHRIELTEINATIMKYPTITKSYTTVYTKSTRDYIVVYFESMKKVLKSDIISFLKTKLADYMIPNFFKQVNSFPLTVNGKIDKKALPTDFIDCSTNYTAPRNKFETELSNIWKNILSLDKIGIDDNFFELGGDSLLALRCQTEALRYNMKISYADIFTYPTIRQLSAKKDVSNITFNTNYNYDEINKLLKVNSINNLSSISLTSNNNIGNILLIGATGFLGAHILDSFLKNQKGIAYCLIRQKPLLEPLERLKQTLNFYFGNKYDSLIGSRIIVIQGDITYENLLLPQDIVNMLSLKISTIVHTAALVKHYGSIERFNDINVIGTKNVADFAYSLSKKLYFISTLSVSGSTLSSVNEQNSKKYFYEKDFYIHQDLSNLYIYTKFLAERTIYEYIEKGLNACVLRIGNLTNRCSDGVFQINIAENAFVNRIKSIINMKVIPSELLSHYVEFTPVDSCATAIMRIIESNPKFNTFHLYDDKAVICSDLIKFLNDHHFDIKSVSYEDFTKTLNYYLNNDLLKSKISGIISDLDNEKNLKLILNILPNSDFTKEYLKHIGFEWPVINSEYIEKYLNYFIENKYFYTED